MASAESLDLRWNHRLRSALLGRRLLPEQLPASHRGQPMFSLWGEDAGIPEDDIHSSRAYRIYVEYDDSLTITDLWVMVDGELLSPCCGYAQEALDEFDYQPILNWCLKRTRT